MIEDKEISIRDDEVEWEFYRSGGHGGQNVNKVSTAVRLTHKSSGIIVTCQTERDQGKNRDSAMKILRAKLWKVEQEKRQKQSPVLKQKQWLPGDTRSGLTYYTHINS